MGQAAAIQMVVGVALTLIGRLFNFEDDSLDMTPAATNAGGTMINTSSSQKEIPLVYGRCRVPINRVYMHTYDAINKRMTVIGILSEGKIEGIAYPQGTYILTNLGMPTSEASAPLIYFDDEPWYKWGDQVHSVKFFNGSDVQVYDPSYKENVDGSFRQNMRHTAYLMITMDYDQDRRNSMPNITAVVDGIKIANPVTGTTVWTDNAALIAYDFLTRPSTRGGMGISTSWIDIASLSDAIDYCDAKGWTFNAAINQNDYAADNLAKILKCYRGKFVPTNFGTYKFTFRDLNYESVAMALDEDDIVEKSLTITQPDILKRPNAIRIKYINEDDNYKVADYVFTDDAAVATDGDYRETTVDLMGLSTLDVVQEMAYYYLERARNGKQITFVGGRRTIALEIEDVVTLEHSMPEWTAQKMRVIASAPDLENMVNHLTCVEESTEFYDQNYDHVHEELFTTNIVSITTPPPSVIFSDPPHSEENYTYSGRVFTRLKVFFDPPDLGVYPWFDTAEVWVKIGTDGTWEHVTNSRSDYRIDPAQVGETYSVKVVSKSVHGLKENFNNAPSISTRILGRYEAPSDLAYLTAVVDGQTINLYSDPIEDAGVDGYETRLGVSFIGGVFVKYTKSASVTLSGVRPGTHTFWMSPVFLDALGGRTYSDTPVSATCTVRIPAGMTDEGSQSWDFDDTGDVHDNTEQTTYNAADALKCSHDGEVLTGEYTSPVWDVGELEPVKVWSDFDTYFTSSVNTVEGIFGTTKTFEYMDAANKTWADLVGVIIGGQVKMTLQYSEDNSTWSEVKFFEVFSADVYARFFKIVVTIIDPTLDSNMFVSAITMKAYSGMI